MATQLPKNEFNSGAIVLDEADASRAPPLPGASADLSDGQDVRAGMHGSNNCGLARDDVKPGDTMQESRPAHPATAPSEISDIPEIFRVANLLCEEARTFIPDYPSIYQAMMDENAPRAPDPVWADPAPLFLKAQG